MSAAKKLLKRKLKIEEEDAVVEIERVDHRRDSVIKKEALNIDPKKADEQKQVLYKYK